MLKGDQVEGCSSCYQLEANNVKSMRQSSLSRGLYHNPNPVDLRYLEIAFSNLCNLACVSCAAFFSSKWKSEDIKHNRSGKDSALISHGYDNLPFDLSKVETLKIIGGEPFLEQEKFISLMQKLDLEKISLTVATNGTVLPNDRLRTLIEQCKSVRFGVSVDGLYTVNDWYRWPSSFSEIEYNLSKYDDWWGHDDRFILLAHHVTNAYNVWTVKEFFDYFRERYPRWIIEWDWIQWPRWQTLSVIPEKYKKELIDKFKEYSISYDVANKPFANTINQLLEDPKESWETFKIMTARFEKERNLNVLDLVPSLREVWKC